MGNYTLDVAGMQCNGCENVIESAVGGIDDVDSVDADHVAGTVKVKVDDDQKNAVIDQVESVGYDVQG